MEGTEPIDLVRNPVRTIVEPSGKIHSLSQSEVNARQAGNAAASRAGEDFNERQRLITDAMKKTGKSYDELAAKGHADLKQLAGF